MRALSTGALLRQKEFRHLSGYSLSPIRSGMLDLKIDHHGNWPQFGIELNFEDAPAVASVIVRRIDQRMSESVKPLNIYLKD